MAHSQRIVSPGRNHTLVSESGDILTPPKGWAFLPAGDAGITRRVKTKGPTWVVQVKRGRRRISKGIWADAEIIRQAKADVLAKRDTPSYQKQMERARHRRQVRQAAYEKRFFAQVVAYLDFHHRYAGLAVELARKVTEHAVPVGSGTVARTERIPVEKRVEAAVIAWMRHHTTAYDTMKIPRVRGQRRQVRRMLARASVKVLSSYRLGNDIDDACPLKKTLQKTPVIT